jgi:hypothetical protein
VAGTCECGNEPSGSKKCGEFLNWLRTVQLLEKVLLHGVNSQRSSVNAVTRLQGGQMRNLVSIPGDEKRSYSA